MFGFGKKTKPKKRVTPSVSHGRRSYAAANISARFSDFRPSILSANAELEVALSVIRARSRDLFRNNPHVRRWGGQLQTNVVGAQGFTLQCRAQNTNGGPDKFGNEEIERYWKDWIQTCTADGQMSFRDSCKLVTRSWGRDGEVFAEIVYGRRFKHGMALHFFEPDLVDETLNDRSYRGTGNRIRMGVEIDAFEKPVAYHVLTAHPGDTTWATALGKRYRRVPAEKIIHVFVKERSHQVRGEPQTAAAILDVKMLAGYRDAELTNRRVAASKGGFFTKDADSTGGIGNLADEENTETGEMYMDLEPGQMRELPVGMDFTPVDMSNSSVDYEQFEKQVIRSIAAALNISYAAIGMDLTDVSYSSIRQGELSDRDVWRDLQKFIIDRFAKRVFDVWLENVLSFTDIRLPYSKYEKFRTASYFQPRGWAWVDPQKEIKASETALEMNLTSLTHIANEQGRDIEDVLLERQTELQLLKQYGLDQEKVDAPPKT